MAMIYLFLLTGLGNLVVSQPDVVRTTPMEDQPVAANFDGNITYNCSVKDGAAAVWSVNGAQIHSMLQMQSFIEDGYDFDPPNTDSASSTLIITAAAWYNNSITVQCLAIANLIERLGDGMVYHVTYYDIPDEVGDLELLSSLRLQWSRPANLNVPTLSQVPITYTIESNATDGSGMNFRNITNETSFSVQFLEDILRDLGSECVEFQFFVFASDDAGSGPLTRVLDTVPISPDVQNVSRDLRVERVDLQQQRVNISFPPVKPCSENFALTNYTVNIDGYVYRNLTPEEVTSGAPLSFNDLPPDRSYSLTIRACNNVTCRTSNSTTVNTTDVQAVSAVFFENRLFLQCSFADNSRARGCVFEFSLIGSNDTSRFNVSREEGFMCTNAPNQRDAYGSVFVMDWEENGMVGNLPLNITNIVRNVSLEEYMELNDCPVEEESVQGNVGVVVGGSVGGVVLFTAIIVAVVVPLIVFLVMHGRIVATVSKKFKMLEFNVNLPDTMAKPDEQEPPEQEPPEQEPPEQEPPERVPPERVPPERVPPERVPPEQVPPERVPPEQVPPEQVPPEQVPPEQVPPEQVPPEQEPPEQVPPEQVPPEQVPPEQEPPERVPPDAQVQTVEPALHVGFPPQKKPDETVEPLKQEGGASGPPLLHRPPGSRVEDDSGDLFEHKEFFLAHDQRPEDSSETIELTVLDSVQKQDGITSAPVSGAELLEEAIAINIEGGASGPPPPPPQRGRRVVCDSGDVVEDIKEGVASLSLYRYYANDVDEDISEDENAPLLLMEGGASGPPPPPPQPGRRVVCDSGDVIEDIKLGVASLSLYAHDIDIDEDISEDENAPLLQKIHTKKHSKLESKLSKLQKKYNDLEKEKSDLKQKHESKVLKLETDLTELKKHLEKAEKEKKEMGERVRLDYGGGGGPLILKIRWQALVDSLRARSPHQTINKDAFSKFKLQLEF